MKKPLSLLLCALVCLAAVPAFSAGYKRSSGRASLYSSVTRRAYQARQSRAAAERRVTRAKEHMEQAWAELQEAVSVKKMDSETVLQKLHALMDSYLCLGLFVSPKYAVSWNETLRAPIQTGKRKPFEIVPFLEQNAAEDDFDAAFFLRLLSTDDPAEAAPLFLEWFRAPMTELAPDYPAAEEN